VTIHAHIGGDGASIMPWVEPTPDGRFVVVTDSRQVDVLAASDGRGKQQLSLEQDVMDVDVVPDSSRLLVTEWHRWDDTRTQPTTHITSLRLGAEGAGGAERIDVPNCASELVLTPDARYAFLAP